MGIEFHNMDLGELDNLLYEVAKDNERDMSTFMNLLVDMYGGIDMTEFERLYEFLHNQLNIHSDAELAGLNSEQKLKIINYINS